MSSSFQLSERFWSLARRLIPKPAKPHPFGGGRPRVPNRAVLAAIIFVLRTGCQWKALDATGLGSGSTAHRRFQEWVRAGLFFRLWRVAARRYDEVHGIDWRWLAVDGCLTKAPLSRSEVVGRNPTDRGKQGVKRSLLVDAMGLPLALVVGPANRNDHRLLAETLDSLVARRPARTAMVQHCVSTSAMMTRARGTRQRGAAMWCIFAVGERKCGSGQASASGRTGGLSSGHTLG
jgi:putative transposase